MLKPGQWKKGSSVWIQCHVKGGPFPNERRVYVKTDSSEWFGFVNVSELKNKVAEGEDQVRAIVLDAQGNHILVGIRGQSPKGGSVQTSSSEITAYGAV